MEGRESDPGGHEISAGQHARVRAAVITCSDSRTLDDGQHAAPTVAVHHESALPVFPQALADPRAYVLDCGRVVRRFHAIEHMQGATRLDDLPVKEPAGIRGVLVQDR
jgi:hypothetical protein